MISLADQIEKMGRAMTAEELSKLLSVSKVTIFKQAAAGRIPSFRVGTCVRFDPKAVANWLRARSEPLPKREGFSFCSHKAGFSKSRREA